MRAIAFDPARSAQLPGAGIRLQCARVRGGARWWNGDDTRRAVPGVIGGVSSIPEAPLADGTSLVAMRAGDHRCDMAGTRRTVA